MPQCRTIRERRERGCYSHRLYKCEDGTRVGELRSTFVLIRANRHVLTPFKKTKKNRTTEITRPKKGNVQPGDAFEDTAFKYVFEIFKFETRL
jgi:hypothetical protein